MPLPKQLSAFKAFVDEALAKGRTKYGKNKDGKWVYTLKRAMKDASKLYKKSKGKTAKKTGGSAILSSPIVGGEDNMDTSMKPDAPFMEEGEDMGKNPAPPITGGEHTGEHMKKMQMGGKTRRSKKSRKASAETMMM